MGGENQAAQQLAPPPEWQHPPGQPCDVSLDLVAARLATAWPPSLSALGLAAGAVRVACTSAAFCAIVAAG